MTRHSWDPLIEAVSRRLEKDLLPTIQAQAKPIPWWKQKYLLWNFKLRHKWIDVVFALLTVVPFGWGVWLLVTTLPWTGPPNTPDFSQVVATAATTTAFGGVLFSLVATPVQRASELAAGYSAELMQRATLWLTGAFLVGLTIALFLLSTANPDAQAAAGSGLLAGSALGLVWMAARQLLASGDPQEVARRVARYNKRASKNSRRFARRMIEESLPKELRGQPAGVLLVRNQERGIVNMFLRHFKEGIRGALAHRSATSAIYLWDASLESFLEYAAEAEGDVGGSDGIIETLLSTADEMVQQGLAIPLDDVAVHPIESIPKLFNSAMKESSFGPLRSVSLLKLQAWIQSAWSDDNTRVPAVAVETIGKLLTQALTMNAHEDALSALRQLHEIGAQGVVDRRTHISKPAFEQVITAFSSILGVQERSTRVYLLTRWASDARAVSRLRLLEGNLAFIRATESIFPGITLWGRGLQEVFAELGPYTELSQEVVRPLAEWLQHALRDFSDQKESIRYVALDALALLYCLSLTQAHSVAGGQSPRPNEAKELGGALFTWIKWLPDDDAHEVLLDPDVAEMVWSLMLALGYIAQDPEAVSKGSAMVLERLRNRLKEERSVHDDYSIEFVTGLLVATASEEKEVEEVTRRLMDRNSWGGSSRGIYIEALGRAPAVNRNRVAIADPRVFEAIDQWAVTEFPGFVSASHST